MKDIVENRARLSFGRKLIVARLALKENGVRWTFMMGAYYLFSGLAERAFDRAAARRKMKGLPGFNSIALNRAIWENWDWAAGGEEWSPSERWKQSLVEHVLERLIPEGGHVLEIGPGAGRWTEFLRRRADRLTGVDLSKACVEACEIRFAEYDNVRFLTTEGSDLTGVDDASVDAVWSFDVFVHINRPEVAKYAEELARVMRRGARGVIHHGNVAGRKGGWRSDMTAEVMREVLEGAGFEVTEQFTGWNGDGEKFEVGLYDDSITVFDKRP